MKKILIISTSPRKGGNSDTLAHEFERGASEAGHRSGVHQPLRQEHCLLSWLPDLWKDEPLRHQG